MRRAAGGARLVAAALALIAPMPAPAAELTGTAAVTDGDTFDIGPVSVRLHGIDAPEAGQLCTEPGGGTWACGTAATERLAGMVDGRAVRCTARDVDRYGRVIAVCGVEDGGADDPDDVGMLLVEEGLAWAFRRYSEDYAAHEDRARATGLGVWRAPTQNAAEYRADRWNRAAAASPRAGCPIKGNVSGGDERIYHTPWSPWYARAQIDEAKGERWFCDEDEAQAAGWRAARWR